MIPPKHQQSTFHGDMTSSSDALTTCLPDCSTLPSLLPSGLAVSLHTLLSMGSVGAEPVFGRYLDYFVSDWMVLPCLAFMTSFFATESPLLAPRKGMQKSQG